ncbi:hypothetical protein [Inquilinus sp. CAU 1745]|uniref:hypothetical protein n=1 Tax=Inquilinus sp. CAU 1745 TaxID=3140369 RepID=UPI00325BE9F7
MPIEIRHIILRREDLAYAVTDYAHRTGMKIPYGRIIGSDLKSGGGHTMSFNVVEDRTGRKSEFKIGNEDLLSAVLMYCGTRKIPIPVHGAKRLKIVRETVALEITSNIDDDKVPLLNELLRESEIVPINRIDDREVDAVLAGGD